jgi:pyruvate dehydrogenase E2 component (dihydrolipoamide acetyltransferase)
MAEVTLPQLGETVTEGTITQWFKQIGDNVAADEPLFEVSTDKVDTEVPSPVAGTLTEIRVQEGETVDVGTVIAVVGDGDGAAPAPAAPAAEEQPAADGPAPEAEAEPEQAAATEAPEAETEGEPEQQPAPEPSPATADEQPAQPAQPAPAATPAEPSAPRGEAAKGILLSPVVRRLVNEHGLDPSTINGSGPGGRITRDDVLDHIDKTGARPQPAVSSPTSIEPTPADEEAEAAPAPAESRQAPAAPAPAAAQARTPAAAAPKVAAGQRDESIPLTKIRKLTGQHMLMSKGVSPHAFSVVEVDFANVDKTRLGIKDEWRRTEGFSLTYLPFISRATIDALLEYPHLNASVGENQLVIHRFIDLGIAVDLDYEGLIVPVIRDAEDLRLRAIARHINDLAGRARTKKLMPDEISGGTFTISNNGSAGSVLTMPIINQPQVAILSTDAITRKPVVVPTTDGGEAIAVHPVGNLAMAWDHRAFDGAYAANFLRRIKEILETRDWSAEV